MRPLRSLAFALLTPACFNLNAQVAEAGPDTSICVDHYTMQGSPVPPGGVGVWTMVSGCGTINDPNNPVTETVNLCTGTNVFEWTVDDGTDITVDQVTITVFDGTMADAYAGMDQTIIAPANSVQLMGAPVPIFPATCYWTIVVGTGVITDPTSPYTMTSGLTVGANIYRWTCFNGPCGTTSDEVNIQMMLSTGLAGTNAPDQTILIHDATNERLILRGNATCDALTIADLSGRNALRPVSATGIGPWSVAGLPEGIYLATATIGSDRHVLRFVVGH